MCCSEEHGAPFDPVTKSTKPRVEKSDDEACWAVKVSCNDAWRAAESAAASELKSIRVEWVLRVGWRAEGGL